MELKYPNCDFHGWATKSNVKCDDGRTLLPGAFKHQDGARVSLIWNHQHDDPDMVIGHAYLEDRGGDTYAYCFFNDTERGKTCKNLVKHGDVDSLSIWANKLTHNGPVVSHGTIRELSLVLSGANPLAKIENVVCHSGINDGEIIVDEARMEFGEPIEFIAHAAEEPAAEEPKKEPEKGKTVKDVFNAFTEEERDAAETIIACAVAGSGLPADKAEKVKSIYNGFSDEQKKAVEITTGLLLNQVQNGKKEDTKTNNENIAHSAEGEKAMYDPMIENDEYLAHSALVAESREKLNTGLAAAISGHVTSLKTYYEANLGSEFNDVMAHSGTAGVDYGITNIDYLFPEYQKTTQYPTFVKERDEWVNVVLDGCHKTPFERIKSMTADLTEDAARARGYVTGNMKLEEVFALSTRTTDGQTIYKKQRLDRDHILQITDIDVVAWLKKEMRMMLNKELAVAILIGDGRSTNSPDKIKEDKIRPIWTDAELYTIHVTHTNAAAATKDQIAHDFMRTVREAMDSYEGSGAPTLFCPQETVTMCMLLEDTTGRVIYDSMDKLKAYLGVSRIVPVPAMKNKTRIVDGQTRYLEGIVVNLADYTIGTNKGAGISMFDDFDIDFNQYKYLIETRCSGALTEIKSAIAVERVFGVTLTVDPEDPEESLYGKTAGDLQEDVVVNDGSIAGTLKYVTGYTGYSGDADEQKGNFLAISVDVPVGATAYVQKGNGPKVEITDGFVVARITDKKQKLKITATANGQTVEKVFDLSLLKLEQA